MALVSGVIGRAAIGSALPTLIRRGLGANASLLHMRGLGYGIQRKTFLSMFRQAAGREIKKNVVKYIRKDYLPGPDAISMTETAMPRRYLYHVELDNYDDVGNFLGTKHTSIMNDEKMSPRDAENAAMALMEEDERYGDMGIFGSPHVLEIMESPGY